MPTLQRFQEAISYVAYPSLTLSKYTFMELSTAQRRKGLEQKVPDISKTLDMVEFLKRRKARATYTA